MRYILKNGIEYKEYNYEDQESLFESEVVTNSKMIFGENVIYVDLKKRLKPKKDKDGTIPDGYLLDFSFPAKPRLYLVENEVRNHSIKNHIVPQLSNFYLNYKDSMNQIKDFIIKYLIENNIETDELCHNADYRNIDDLLTNSMLNEKLGVILVIDDADERLYDLKNCFGFDLEIIEMKKYISSSNEEIFLYDKFNEEEVIVPTNDYKLDTIVVAGYEEGFQTEFLGNNCWFPVSINTNRLEELKYIAVYQKSPIKAITYWAEIDRIELYGDTGKYIIYFKDKAKKLKNKLSLNPKHPNRAPQPKVYTNINRIIKAKKTDTLDVIYR